MKKILPVLVILLFLGVGGYFFLNSQNKQTIAPENMMQGKKTSEEGNVFTSIKDALSKSVSLECTYNDEEGVSVKSYIKGGGVRSMMTAKDPKQPNNFIMKDNKMYMWNDTTKEGFMTTWEMPKDITPNPTLEAMGKEEEKTNESDSLLAQMEKYKDACKPAVVADSLFTPPTDVKFQDMSAVQKQMMEQLSKTPEQNGQSGQMSEEDLKKLMEQYGGTSQ
ncbi:hypothetical protein A2866_00150 [Candidatus Roizmanbacteria bacterium RIFCSPHIGHO2_01_FULL_39_8]|uniref:Uncharacterized protein n=3 Tax=Candidatus Roizmaniibacteriota TaxID=1752723 RepID=A0A1F7GKQ8_9BACT|nr:MAG: hypothetical protein A2866_00150 [Candidatus Roizmanbacteria bacterium RIFCSPHIGHO2_01_FULL_39_8]OGK27090.1 MAG: hypothetical protein A3C28_03020 [Candidatus Roizmanbacteria bacterium RIFCSPHIGHO2_02_FULL_39_9]OGK35208.1 MAG: hypothetical protein A3F60_03800 [Candidatus Roizmanbacteria bacterium RIFCSPHIGHO2_12_FULL_39_8]